MTLEPGLRVVRGPDWQWQEQDGGAGHAGTVISFGRTDPNAPLNTVNVRWDRGLRGDYRMGFGDAYDLRLLDNGPVGDWHREVSCEECRMPSIPGIRWQCRNILSYNLCSRCYHGGSGTKVDYQFNRIIVPGAKWVLMPKRSTSQQTEVKGLFPGAKVIKGSDLELSVDDDRKRYVGTLFSLCEWEAGHHNTGAVVDWPPCGRDTYRLGYRGKVDLKTKQPGSGGQCYLDHLPVLGMPIEMQSVSGLMVGDHVTIILDRDVFKDLQEGHGDWVPGMAEDIGHVGIIRDITVRKNVVVEYPQRCRKWIFHPAALTKVEKFEVGDSVSITADLINALNIHMKHAMSGNQLQNSVGKLATVMEVDESGSYRIRLDESGQDLDWVNPVILKALVKEASPGNGSLHKLKDVTERIGLDVPGSMSNELHIAIEAARGNVEAVQKLIRCYPERVNDCWGHKTALQLACHGGFMEVVQTLLNGRAKIDSRDQDGDTALVYAIYGNHPVIVDYLLLREADVNVVNEDLRCALHQAVTRDYVDCVKILLRQGSCDVNIQDNFGDTALHDAISGESKEIVSLLLSSPTVNLKLTNQRQFNAVQWAALKGNLYAINKMITKEEGLASIPNVEGLTPLHIAAMHNFPDIVRNLIVKGHCDVDVCSKGHQTPLLLAVSAGHVEVIEVLLTHSADVNAADADGDTSLHIALLRQVIFQKVTETILIQKIQARIPDKTLATSGLALACLLVENKADLGHMNNKGKTCFDIVPDEKIHAVLRHFARDTAFIRESDTFRSERRCKTEFDLQSTPPNTKHDRPMPLHLQMQEEKYQSLKPRRSLESSSRPSASPVEQEITRQGDKKHFSRAVEGSPRQQEVEECICVTPPNREMITKQRQKEQSLLLHHGTPPPDSLQQSSVPQEVRWAADSPQESPRSETSTPDGGTGPEHIARQLSKEAQFLPLAAPPSTPQGGAGGDATSARHGLPRLYLTPRPLLMTAAGDAQFPSPVHSQTPVPMSYVATPTPTTLAPNLARCRLGCSRIADGQFMPCHHIIVCYQCSECFKLCPECKGNIESVIQLGRTCDVLTNTDPAMGQQAATNTASSGNESPANSGLQDSDLDLTRSVLIQKNRKLAEELECGICFSRKKEFVFMCGHSLCRQCVDSMDDCPFCRATIQKKIKMY